MNKINEYQILFKKTNVFEMIESENDRIYKYNFFTYLENKNKSTQQPTESKSQNQ